MTDNNLGLLNVLANSIEIARRSEILSAIVHETVSAIATENETVIVSASDLAILRGPPSEMVRMEVRPAEEVVRARAQVAEPEVQVAVLVEAAILTHTTVQTARWLSAWDFDANDMFS